MAHAAMVWACLPTVILNEVGLKLDTVAVQGRFTGLPTVILNEVGLKRNVIEATAAGIRSSNGNPE